MFGLEWGLVLGFVSSDNLGLFRLSDLPGWYFGLTLCCLSFGLLILRFFGLLCWWFLFVTFCK